MLVQRDPTPITFGGGLRVGLTLGPQWYLIGSAGATIRVMEQVDRIWGSPRMLAAGGAPQHNVGSIIHQRHHALVSAERRSRERGPHLAIGLGTGYYRYYRKIDLQITILESGDQHRSTYDRIEDSFLVLPYVGIRLPALGGEFYSDVGGMLVTHQVSIEIFFRTSAPGYFGRWDEDFALFHRIGSSFMHCCSGQDPIERPNPEA